jgi:uncharacterized membrane protein YidH (DUF202 family)
MTREQLDEEARAGRTAGFAAIAGAVLFLASLVLGSISGRASQPGRVAGLVSVDQDAVRLIVSVTLLLLANLLLAVALAHLYRVTKARRPETPRPALQLAIAGPVLFGVSTLGALLARIAVADTFLASGPRTDARAKELLQGDLNVFFAIVQFAGGLALAFALVLLNLNGLRAGTLSRFMGVLGIIIGFLTVVPLLPGGAATAQILWLGALGVLFLDRWPGGRGPAWPAGEAMRWPGAGEQRMAIERQRARERAEAEGVPVKGGGGDRTADSDPPEPADDEAGPDGAAGGGARAAGQARGGSGNARRRRGKRRR